MYAIVKTGGKQYKVAPGDKLNIEKLDAAVGRQGRAGSHLRRRRL